MLRGYHNAYVSDLHKLLLKQFLVEISWQSETEYHLWFVKLEISYSS